MSCARRKGVVSCFQRNKCDYKAMLQPVHNCEEHESSLTDKFEEKPCVWCQCPGKECVQYSCYGQFDMEKWRPKCSEALAKPRKECKPYCYVPFGCVLPVCKNPCPPSRFECPEPEPPPAPKAPWRQKGCPLFLWTDGYATVNIRNVPYFDQNEGLKFKERVKNYEEKIDPREVELWSQCCMDGTVCPPAWKTIGTRIPWACRPEAPLTLWSDGHPKHNRLRLPYPGHGFKYFDSCLPCNRKSFPPQCLARNTNGVFAPPQVLCGKPYCI